ncbi:hypothetical protein NXU92_22340, partial [Bacteroides fragilis]|nr:hypothetical protein [Bacteroides fragilis]
MNAKIKEFVWEGKRWFDVVRMHDANGKSLGIFCYDYPADKSILIRVKNTSRCGLLMIDAHGVSIPC